MIASPAPSFSSRKSSLALTMPHWAGEHASHDLPGTPALRTRALLEKMDSPHLRLPPVVHVGGTKGKGSTIAFLRTMLEQAGYRVHAYTSPHLDRFNERIVLAGSEIDDAALYSLMEETRIAAADMPLAFFDATTAAAMLAFANCPADIVLLETGMGGNKDATSIIPHPLLTILTTVSYDHMLYMGETLADIAACEAGIFQRGTNAIISYQAGEAMQAIKASAIRAGTALYAYGQNWQTVRSSEGMIFCDSHGDARLPLPSLLGAHQLVNAGNAIAAISTLTDFEVSQENIIAGLMQTRWKGRLEQIPCHLLPPSCELWFDGGHNSASSGAISLFARQCWHDMPLYLIFGTTSGKDILPMLAPFADIAQAIYSVTVKSEPDSYNAETICQIAAPLVPVTACDSMEDALHTILSGTSEPFRILVFGSLYLWLEANHIK